MGWSGPCWSLITESFVTFSREVSIIAVRGQNGDVKTWPLAENHHHHGILSHSIVPAPNSADLQPVAQDYITRLLNHLNYVGVLTLELFVTDKVCMPMKWRHVCITQDTGRLKAQYALSLKTIFVQSQAYLGFNRSGSPYGHDQYYWSVSTV